MKGELIMYFTLFYQVIPALFNPEWSLGDIKSIGFIGDFIGKAVVIILSFCGLLIVASSTSNMALAGLYVSNPKLWDKVDEAHRIAWSDLVGEAKKGGKGNEAIAKYGIVIYTLMKIFPNIKGITEFEDEAVDAKSFFITALPKALIFIFIGVFIYFGYTTKIGEKFSTTATGFIDLVLDNVDPVQWVEAIPDKLLVLNLSTDGSDNPFDKVVYSATKKAYSSTTTKLSDMTKEARARVANQIESWIITEFESNIVQYCDDTKYDITLDTRVTDEASNLDRVNAPTSSNVKTFACQTQLSSFTHGSAIDNADNFYLRVDFVAKPKAVKPDDVSSVQSKMSGGQLSVGESELTIRFNVDNNASGRLDAQGATCTINEVSCNISVSDGTSTLIIKPKNKSDFKNIKNATRITNIQGLAYVYGNGRHYIREITLGGGTVQFTPIDSTSIGIWNWGEQPKTNTSNETNSNTNEDDIEEDLFE